VLVYLIKLLERLALQRIPPTVEGLLSPDQAGFRKGRSICDQVAALTTSIKNGFQLNLKIGAVFLDLTSAYDTVWHTGLLYKLSKSMPYWFTRLVGLLLQQCVHLHNTSTTRELSVYLDGQRHRHECHPTYLGVTLDCTLSYRVHLTKTAGKLKN